MMHQKVADSHIALTALARVGVVSKVKFRPLSPHCLP